MDAARGTAVQSVKAGGDCPNNPPITCANFWARKMVRLILMRHAKSSWDNPALEDHKRPLNTRGRASATLMGDWLRKNSYLPDAAISSSATRTGETFLGLGIDVPVRFEGALYHAGPDVMMRKLRTCKANSILMLGHNPGICMFAHQLLPAPPDHQRFADYPTCATTVIDFDVSWPSVEWNTGHFIDFAIPRELLG